MPRNSQAALPLAGFQKAWIADKSRYKFAVKPRRVGWTFASTLEIALDSVERRTKWLIVSRTKDTAREAAFEVKRFFTAMEMVAAALAEVVEEENWFGEARIHTFFMDLPNGSRIQAMTAHPDAIRGFGGNVLLDEFGFHADSFSLWKAAYAAILRGHRLLVQSTPNCRQGKYFELARGCGLVEGEQTFHRKAGIWSAYWLDIFSAAPQLAEVGVPIDIDELRELAGDEESFQQEFCCAFLESTEQWIPFELIAAARSAVARREWDPERPVAGTLYAGFDVARRKDGSVIWIDEVFESLGISICVGVIEMYNTPFSEQERIAGEVLAHPKLKRMCIDETGLGMQIAETLKRQFGYKVEPITFNLATKEAMSVRLRGRMEEKLDKIPDNAPDIEKQFSAIKRQPTNSGTMRFDAERSDKGHADAYWAKALADEAMDRPSSVGIPYAISSGVKHASVSIARAF